MIEPRARGHGAKPAQGGRRVTFFRQRDGSYLAQPGVVATLTLNAGAYALRDADGTMIAFNTLLDSAAHYQMDNRQGGMGATKTTFAHNIVQGGGAVAKKSTVLFAEALSWMEAQFKALGQGADSRGLALHLLSALQGVSVLAHTFHDPGLIEIEATRLKKWIRALDTEHDDKRKS